MSAVEDPRHLDGEEWRADASCRGMDPEIFHPVSKRYETSEAASALAVCAGCPVSVDCLDFALTAGIDEGIYGGRTETERRRLRRKLRIAPPVDLDAYLFPTATPEDPDDHDDD